MLTPVVFKEGVAALAAMAQGEEYWLSDDGKGDPLGRSGFERKVR